MRLIMALLLIVPLGCKKKDPSKQLVIFHAGSLSMPFKKIARDFEREHQGVQVLLEAAGSRVCARKISDLNRRADIMASADYTVISSLLIPEHADFTIRFAGNEMVIAYKKHSKKSSIISTHNWHEVLSDSSVVFGRSDPNSDPCGYRSVMVMKLAERYYKKPGLADMLLKKDLQQIRPKETDLLALLDTGVIDYLFIYRSVAVQHGLPFIALPDEINLRSPALANLYGTVSVTISGKKPGTFITKKGAPMVYGVTIPKNAPNRVMALKFMEYLLARGKGGAVLEAMGQKSLVPAPSNTYDAIPTKLKQFAKPSK